MSRMISGMMRIAEKTDAEIRALYEAARVSGVDTFDHADIYGWHHLCECRFADALRLSSAEREEIVLQTKTGISLDPPLYDHSYEHIVSSVDESLRALRTDYIDVLLLHRPDALVEPEEVARAFAALKAAGKVRTFGVSNHTPGQIALLETALEQPLVVNQVQFSLVHAGLVADGMNGVASGLVDFSRVRGMRLQAWSPLQGIDGPLLHSPAHPKLNAELEDVAHGYGVTAAAIAIAWILRHPAAFEVVLGTTNPSRFTDAVSAKDLQLSREEWYRLYRAAGHALP